MTHQYIACSEDHHAVEEALVGNIHYPIYSPDFAPSNFHRFPHLKEHLGGQLINAHEEKLQKVVHFATRWINILGQSFYQKGIFKLISRRHKSGMRLKKEKKHMI